MTNPCFPLRVTMQIYPATICLPPLPTSLFRLNAWKGRVLIISEGIDSCKCHQASDPPEWSVSRHTHPVSHSTTRKNPQPLKSLSALLPHPFFPLRRGKGFPSLRIWCARADVYKPCFSGLTCAHWRTSASWPPAGSISQHADPGTFTLPFFLCSQPTDSPLSSTEALEEICTDLGRFLPPYL